MTTTKTSDINATTSQIHRLEKLGCDIIRVAVPDMDSANAITKIKEKINIPLVADIHFDHKLAIRSVEAGADKIRINPGNIGSEENVKAVATMCKSKHIPIRIGVNSGSLEKEILKKHGTVTAEAMVESALTHVRLLNKFDFDDIWLSVKTSNVRLTVNSYRLLSKQTNYPLHIGLTEAGSAYSGTIKSSMAIGALLLDGIGDTIRVSLTAEPEEEVKAGIAILKALGLRDGIDIISCPTCGRCKIDIIALTNEVETHIEQMQIKPGKNITIAIMGCAVNGPGEASHADFGIAGGDGDGVIFAKGKIIAKVPEDQLVKELLKVISK